VIPWELLRRVAREKIKGRPLFVTISGAHLYGFASPDSDFDLRGAHLLPLTRVVSLFPPAETIEYSGVVETTEMDVVSHEAAKFFGLMLKKNGYVMEQIFSPLVVEGGDFLEELRPIARRCLTRHLYHHYRGFAENQKGLLEKESPKRAKSMLYLYRVLLTGIHVLRTGQIEADLCRLVELYPQAGIDELIAAKTVEKAGLSQELSARHELRCAALRAELDAAFEGSSLPETAAGAKELDELLVRLRVNG
jgi:predicted nucleotidyltransferase